MSELKKLSEIDLENLPVSEPLNVLTLRGTIERGVKNVIKPFQIAKELDEPGEYSLQIAYEAKIKEMTDGILEVVVNELYLKP